MEHVRKTIDVGDWTMDVHAERQMPDGGWTLSVSQIRSLGQQVSDWTDVAHWYASAELAIEAARTWAGLALR